MDFGTYVALLVLGWIAIGLPIIAIVKWKKKEIKPLRHLVPFAVFALIDIVGQAMGTLLAPAFLPAMAVVIIGIQFRQGGWPSTPKFATYYKLYILILAICLIPALMLLSTAYYLSLPLSQMDVAKLMTSVVGGIIVPGLVFAFSDPTNRYRQREPENLVGAGLGFLGSVLGIILSFVLRPVIDGMVIVFMIPALVASLLIFLPFLLPAKPASEPTPT